MTRPVIRFSGIKVVLLAAGLASLVLWMSTAPAQNLIDATMAAGEKVRLHPNGRWEYVDVQKAAAAKAVADQYPETVPARLTHRVVCWAWAAA